MFDREIAPIYPKTTEGQRAPLRRVNIDQSLPPDLSFIVIERITPQFVLVANGREIAHPRLSSEDRTLGIARVLIKKLDSPWNGWRTRVATRKSLRTTG